MHYELCIERCPVFDAALFRVEVHADHDNRQAAGLEFFVIMLINDLVDGLLSRFVQLEFKDVDVPPRADVRVDAALVRPRLRLYDRPQQPEHDEEDGLVVFLVRQMQVVADVRQERLEELHEPGQVVRGDGVRKRIDDGAAGPLFHVSIVFKQPHAERLRDLEVGKIQSVLETGAPPPHLLDGQVARLPQQPGDVEPVQLVGGEDALAVEARQRRFIVVAALAGHVQEERRHPRAVPVVGEFVAFVEELRDGDGVADMRFGLGETVAVVPFQEFSHQLLLRDAVRLRGQRNAVREIFADLRLREPEHPRVFRIQRDVRQVVQIREERDMRELAHARDEREADESLAFLDGRIEPFQFLQYSGPVRFVADIVEDRLVIFIDQHHDAGAGIFRRVADEILEADGGALLPQRQPEIVGRHVQKMVEIDFQLLRRPRVAIAEIQMDDGIRLPIVVGRLNIQSFEKFLSSQEDGLQRRDQQ